MDRELWSVCTDLFFPRRIGLRSDKTRRQYQFALNSYAEHLGHPATLADLDDDLLTVWTTTLLNSGLSAYTVREKVGRILTLWRWLAARREVDRWPTVTRPPAPEPLPVAANEDQLRRLFHSAAKERGAIEGVPADLWWLSLFGFVWCTAERKTAALAVRVEWLDLAAGCCTIPANVRKGGRKNAVYHLWPELVPLLSRSIAACPGRELLWPWPYHEVTFYNRFSRIAVDAGWPDDRKHKCHCLRVSHATWRQVAGGDASRALMHSDPATTRRHYLDPRMLPADDCRLFVPWDEGRARGA
jgi:integrase